MGRNQETDLDKIPSPATLAKCVLHPPLTANKDGNSLNPDFRS
jgi:hypothetical protein